MNESRLIKSQEIPSLINSDDLANAASLLLKLQQTEWKELAKGYNNLELVKTKSLWFEGYKINLQFNPGRIKSTSAEIDKSAINSWACFLCDTNLPAEQKGIKVLGKYIILCNPYPVFPEHFTIASMSHQPQEILKSFRDFIFISKALGSKYTLIYNGPNCGASAPDHLHFQAGTKKFMPIENDFHSLVNEYGEIINEDDRMKTTSVDDGLRKFFSIEANDEKIFFNVFGRFYEIYKKFRSPDEEPMMNLICNHDENVGWRLIIFVRSRHRSSHYYFKGESKIMVSPAAIDLGGVAITPLAIDFERVNNQLIKEIYTEVFIPEAEFEQLKTVLKKALPLELF